MSRDSLSKKLASRTLILYFLKVVQASLFIIINYRSQFVFYTCEQSSYNRKRISRSEDMYVDVKNKCKKKTNINDD